MCAASAARASIAPKGRMGVWLRVGRGSLSCKTGRGLGCGWHFGDLRILERDDLPLFLFLYDDQRWAGFYFARFVSLLELHLRSGEYQRNIGAQKANAPWHETGLATF